MLREDASLSVFKITFCKLYSEKDKKFSPNRNAQWRRAGLKEITLVRLPGSLLEAGGAGHMDAALSGFYG
jgi:hypothetical protein